MVKYQFKFAKENISVGDIQLNEVKFFKTLKMESITKEVVSTRVYKKGEFWEGRRGEQIKPICID